MPPVSVSSPPPRYERPSSLVLRRIFFRRRYQPPRRPPSLPGPWALSRSSDGRSSGNWIRKAGDPAKPVRTYTTTPPWNDFPRHLAGVNSTAVPHARYLPAGTSVSAASLDKAGTWKLHLLSQLPPPLTPQDATLAAWVSATRISMLSVSSFIAVLLGRRPLRACLMSSSCSRPAGRSVPTVTQPTTRQRRNGSFANGEQSSIARRACDRSRPPGRVGAPPGVVLL